MAPTKFRIVLSSDQPIVGLGHQFLLKKKIFCGALRRCIRRIVEHVGGKYVKISLQIFEVF